MPGVLLKTYEIAEQSLLLSALLAVAVLAFIGFFLVPWVGVRAKLSFLARHLNTLKQSGSSTRARSQSRISKTHMPGTMRVP